MNELEWREGAIRQQQSRVALHAASPEVARDDDR